MFSIDIDPFSLGRMIIPSCAKYNATCLSIRRKLHGVAKKIPRDMTCMPEQISQI